MNVIDSAYSMFCTERFPLPSESRVADLERQFGVPLPADYRRFLLEYNGGLFTEPRITPLVDGCPSDRLTELAGVDAPHDWLRLGEPGGYTPAMFDDNDPPQILPIGYTLMGNLIFLMTEPGAIDCGQIGLKLAFSGKSFSLGDSIEQFFRLLKEAQDK